MQIHELQEYSGVPGSGSVLAIDDGTNTRKIVPTNLGIQTEMTQEEAETGTSTDKRIVTPQVFHDSVLGIVNTSNTGRVWYGTCPTEAAGTGSNPKIVTVEDGFQLTTGATIAVKFTNAAIGQPGQSRSLQVNGTAATPVMAGGVTAYNQQLWDAGDVVLFVYDGTNWQMASSPRGRLTPSTSWDNITTGTHNQTWAYREGNVVNLRVAVQTSSSVSAGGNLFVGTLATESLRPVAAANSVAYVNSAAVVGILTPAGVLTARVTGAAVAARTAAYLAFTYLAG